MADIFISYSRRDSAFAKQLTNAFEKTGRDVWIDWEDIPRAADWLNEIYDGIEKADTMVQIVSTHSLMSEICQQEVAYARKHAKRIIPVIHENMTPDVMLRVRSEWEKTHWKSVAEENWSAISHLNWIFFLKDETESVPEDVFDREFTVLAQTIETDLTHTRFHTRYLVQAIDWQSNAHNPSYLLFGDELTSAEKWLAAWEFDRQCRLDAGETKLKQPVPTDLQREFITISREVEHQRAARLMELEISRKMSEEAARQAEQSAKRSLNEARVARRSLIGLGVIGALIMVAVFFFTTGQINQARGSEQSAATSAANAQAQVTEAGQRIATAEIREQQAVTQVAAARATLAPIPPTLTRSSLVLEEALTNVADARGILGAIPPTLTYVSNEIAMGEERIEALRMASYAQQYLNGSEPNAELAALFAIRALNSSYVETADAVLVPAAERLHTLDVFDISASTELSAAVISQDGRRVYTGSFNGTLNVWDTTTGALIRSLERQSGAIIALALAPDEENVIVALNDQSLFVLDGTTGAFVRAMPSTYNYISELDVSPDGRMLLSGGRNGTLYLWDIATGTLIRRFTGHNSEILSQAFSVDGRLIVSTANEPTARLWNVSTGEMVQSFTQDFTGVDIVTLSPDNRYVLSGSIINGALRLWDVETGAIIRQFGDGVSVAAPLIFSPDGRQVLAGAGGSGLRLWDVETGTMLRAFEGHSAGLIAAAFKPNGTSAISASSDGSLRAWNLNFDTRSHYLLTGSMGPVLCVAVSPDGQTMLSGGVDTIRLWDVRTSTVIRTLDGHVAPIFKVSYSPDGQTALSASFDGSARLWDVHTGQLLHIFNTLEPLFTAAFAPDGRSIITGSQVGTVNQYDVETGTLIRELVPQADQIWSINFTPDGRRMMTTANDGEILVTTFGTTDILSIFQNNTPILDAAISPDGQMFAVAASDYSVRLRNFDSGATLRILRGHTNVINALAFSPDGALLITGSSDNTLRLWDVATGVTLRVLNGHEGVVRDVAFAPDGSHLFSASFDGTVRLWDVNYQVFVANVCAALVRDFTPGERERFGVSDTPTCP